MDKKGSLGLDKLWTQFPVVSPLFVGPPLVLTFSLPQLLHPTMPGNRCGRWGSTYLMFAVLHVHGAGPVGDLVGLVLLVRLQGDELGPLPVLALNDGVQIPGLVGAV